MTKAELIERIIDSFDDMSGECPTDYLGLEPLTLAEATTYLAEQRANERDCDLEPDECLPAEVTPELYMEASNCYFRMMQFKARAEQIADYFDDHHEFLAYCFSRCVDYAHSSGKCLNFGGPDDMCPMDFFMEHLEEGNFFFDTNRRTFSKEEILKMFADSIGSIDTDDEYICFYDYGTRQKLMSTDDPTEAVEVDELAKCITEDRELFELFIHEMVEDDDLVEEIFNCTKEDLLK